MTYVALSIGVAQSMLRAAQVFINFDDITSE